MCVGVHAISKLCAYKDSNKLVYSKKKKKNEIGDIRIEKDFVLLNELICNHLNSNRIQKLF